MKTKYLIENKTPEELAYEEAKKQVNAIKAFYCHLVVYVVVNFGLFLINILSDSADLWFYWPLIGWGMGLLAHGINVFIINGIFDKKWKEKKINELISK